MQQRATSCLGVRAQPRVARPASLVQIPCPGASSRPRPASPRSRSLFGGLQQQQQRSVVARGLFGLGVPELVVIAGVAALIFGPSKLPELGKGLGKTVKSFQTAAKEFETELKAATADDADAAKPKDGEKKAE
jgi:sec-independent protein translocase protein TatA